MVIRVLVGFVCIEILVAIFFTLVTGFNKKDALLCWAMTNGVAAFLGFMYALVVGLAYAFTGTVSF